MVIERKIPDYLSDVLVIKPRESPLDNDKVEVIVPSGQFWGNLSDTGKKDWKDIVKSAGKNPEDYLNQMRQMFPKNPRGAR